LKNVYPHQIALVWFILAIGLAGCSNTSVLTEQPPSESEANYTVVIYIHGDSDYLFHQSDRTAVRADQHALQKAINVAEQAHSGEVFIFHQRPQKKLLWLFPRRSSELHHYRKGEKLHHVAYRHSGDQPFLKMESDLFGEYDGMRADNQTKTYFFYFGHEIPQVPQYGYSTTLSGVPVHTETFVEGIQGFRNGEAPFELIALSTCSNGTPAMVRQLEGVSKTLLASPQNLHLSYLDIESLSKLETDPAVDSRNVAKAIAEDSFNRLSENVQTVISLAVYDLDATAGYIDRLYEKNRSYQEIEKPNFFRENIDCSELPFFSDSEFNAGIDTFYRPPRFGSRASADHFSGWGCKSR